MCQFWPAEVAANPNNPYAQFKCCCSTFNIKEHAQLCGVLSFTLFLTLVLISMMLFGSLSLFYIVLGVVVYSLLMKTLFGGSNKLALLFYLFFEALQIGFYLALILYIIFPLLFLQIPRRNCYNATDESNGSLRYRSQICDEPKNQTKDYVELLLFVSLLASIKMYFARVFAHFYKYLTWNEQNSLHRAQYINGRGIHFSMGGAHFSASVWPHFGWDTPSPKDVERGPQRQQSGTNSIGELPIMEMPPTYAQVMAGQQQQQQRRRTEEQQTSGTTHGQQQREEGGGGTDQH